ncbi:MAG: transketolase [Gammaproteobacteria bacterium RIFCSPHIGHO2_12_FULL_41_15]|nr:MAG: transketolase [Gammaproteobacteria bacterium RIFCSPHIGHO2_12_FULL_41_15]
MPSRRDCANALRVLAMDAVQKAQSGHPGMPMGMADIAEVLWRDFLQFNPKNPEWPNRDRFILSNGHGVMLQYALLHLTGFDLSLEDIRQFRQLHSRTPGHPEKDVSMGIETTTGPLGQGLANGVGVAIAEQILAETFNRPGHTIVDHHTYVFVGDGCLMEGISHEACSLAGTLSLGKLIVFYDDNGISIDGNVQGWFTDNTPERFAAYHWHVIPAVDGHDPEAIHQAIQEARAITDKPSLICCKTQIAYGAPRLAGSAAAHGAPLGEEEVALTRAALHWPHPPFVIPDDIYDAWNARSKGEAAENDWKNRMAHYAKQYPDLAQEFWRRTRGELPDAWRVKIHSLMRDMQTQGKNNATRKDSLHCLNTFAPLLPELVGGSADLSESNCTEWAGAITLGKNQRHGNYIKYGVREFAMSAIMNGLAIHGGIIPFGGTFLTFSDYARNAVRLAAMMQAHVIFVYSHDSIGLGEDGPTHQPIEQLASLRLIPGLNVWRPGDGVETAVAWQAAIEHSGPSCLLLTRQPVTHQSRHVDQLAQIARGGYVLWEAPDTIEAILMATGSEVTIAVEAAQQLQLQGISVRVVSLPCCEVFRAQEERYREAVLPRNITKRLAIEAGVPDYWYSWVGDAGKVIGLHRFGASAPYKTVLQEYGLSASHVIAEIHTLLGLPCEVHHPSPPSDR